MLCLITISLFIGVVFSLKNSGERSFKDIHWKDGSTRNTFEIKTNNQNVQLQVVDYKNIGDIFEVFDNGVSLGKTSTPGNSDEFASSPEEALAKEGFSKGIFNLAAGVDHKITIEAISAHNEGTAAVRLLEDEKRVSMRMVKRSEGHHHHHHHHDDWDDNEGKEDCEEEHDEEDCDIEVDYDHTITLYKTTFVDSPEDVFKPLTVGIGEEDNILSLDFDGHNYGGVFQSPIAQDTARENADSNTVFAFCGDGLSDISAAKHSDLLFARNGKDLANYCEKENIPFTGFDSFSTIHTVIKDLVDGKSKLEKDSASGYCKVVPGA